jgi:hypothetical protein
MKTVIRKKGRLPRGEAAHNASRRIQSTDPHQSHKHEHLGEDLIPKGEPPHNRARRLQHVEVSGTGKGIGKILATAREKKARRMSHETEI